MKRFKSFSMAIILVIVTMLCACFGLVGCTDDGNDDTGTYYTVTFDSCGGSAVKSQQVLKGNLVKNPYAPKRENYSFIGWYKSADNNAEEWKFATDRVNDDITLYAKWQSNGQPSEITPNETTVYLTFGNETVTAQLYDNATARDLVSRLPLTLEFSDYNNTEKIAYLPDGSSALDTSDAPETYTPAAGEMTVYIPWGNLAIFYNAFSASAGLAPFGKIGSDGIAKLSQISNKTQITITKDSPELPTDKPKVLVAYFSCTNTTKGVAQTIHSQVDGSDIYEIVPASPYTSADLNYNDRNSRSTKEQNDSTARPAISGSVGNIEQYDVIFIGYPIWHGQAPKIIYTFLESYNFSGKTIIPFCTSASSPMGSSATNLHSLAPSANWRSGARISGNNVSSLIAQMNSDVA